MRFLLNKNSRRQDKIPGDFQEVATLQRPPPQLPELIPELKKIAERMRRGCGGFENLQYVIYLSHLSKEHYVQLD